MEKSKFTSVPWIFFDLDDTIWNFSANSTLSLKKLYEISPILRKLFKDTDEFISIYHIHNARMWDLYSRGEVSTKDLKVERWRRTLATKTFEVLTAVCEELDTTYLEILAQEQEMIPGMKDLLGSLSKKAMLAVLSNGFSKTQYRKLQYSGLWKYITRTIVSEEIGINKPNPKLFEYAIQETGAFPPFLMIGDHPETDILGAMAAGWNAIWFNPTGKTFPFTEEELQSKGINPSLLLGTALNTQQLESLINSFLQSQNH